MQTQNDNALKGWEYRVVEVDDMYTIYEVKFNTKGEVVSWIEYGAEPIGDSLTALREDLEMMLAAMDKGVLRLQRTGKQEIMSILVVQGRDGNGKAA